MRGEAGGVVSTVIESAVELGLARLVVLLSLPTSTAWFSKVCVAVIEWLPAVRVTVPLVVTSTDVPVALALPIKVPSE